MSYDFSGFKKRGEEVEEWLRGEFAHLQTGRATPALLDSVMVEAYGENQPLKNVASISVEDARTLRIKPWDKTLIKEIEKAISSSSLGVNPIADGEGVRLPFPELTEERREHFVKILHSKLEEARVSLRQERDSVWHDIGEKEKSKEISEDDKFRFKDELEKLVDEANKRLGEFSLGKEKEIRG